MRDFDFRMIFDDFGEEPGQRGPGSVGQRWVELGREPYQDFLDFRFRVLEKRLFVFFPLDRGRGRVNVGRGRGGGRDGCRRSGRNGSDRKSVV